MIYLAKMSKKAYRKTLKRYVRIYNRMWQAVHADGCVVFATSRTHAEVTEDLVRAIHAHDDPLIANVSRTVIEAVFDALMSLADRELPGA